MKANEAPERIYISVIPSEFEGNKTITCGKDFPNAIEYTLTNAFIEKACDWLKDIFAEYENMTDYNPTEDFKNYMEG